MCLPLSFQLYHLEPPELDLSVAKSTRHYAFYLHALMPHLPSSWKWNTDDLILINLIDRPAQYNIHSYRSFSLFVPLVPPLLCLCTGPRRHQLRGATCRLRHKALGQTRLALRSVQTRASYPTIIDTFIRYSFSFFPLHPDTMSSYRGERGSSRGESRGGSRGDSRGGGGYRGDSRGRGDRGGSRGGGGVGGGGYRGPPPATAE